MKCSECVFGVYYADDRLYDCNLSMYDGEKCPNLQESEARVMNKYQIELQKLKPYDDVNGQVVDSIHNYMFLYTAGHGYLVVPKDDENYCLAKDIVEYGFVGELAIYLEEDCEAGEFIGKLQNVSMVKVN